jgi:hypothetical protein
MAGSLDGRAATAPKKRLVGRDASREPHRRRVLTGGKPAARRTVELPTDPAPEGEAVALRVAARGVADQPDVKPDLAVEGCDHRLPGWGVTRQFDFGQFVILYHQQPNSTRAPEPVVLADGDVVIPLAAAGRPAASTARAAIGGVPLQLLFEARNAVDLVNEQDPERVIVSDLKAFLGSGSVANGNRTYRASLPAEARNRLVSGSAVRVLGRVKRGKRESPRLLELVPQIEDVTLDDARTNSVLSTGRIALDNGEYTVALTDFARRALLARREVVVGLERRNDTKLARFKPSGTGRPLATRYEVEDLASFLAEPAVLGRDLGRVNVQLGTDAVAALRTEGRAMVRAGGEPVEIIVRSTNREGVAAILERAGPGALPGGARALPSDGLVAVPLGELGPGGIPMPQERSRLAGLPLIPPIIDELPTLVEPNPNPTLVAVRPGLQIAVLLPWRQTWRLDGFSRGSLLSTIALAPGEETVIAVQSWERRARALEQQSETEVEQQFDFTQTTRDTEDVFRELTNRNDFQQELHGQLDLSYTSAVATVSLGVGGSVTNATSLAGVFRTTQNHVRETTNRASTRVRSKRITKISQTIEQGLTQEVVRRIRNPNQCHTLTLDFHEVLAHYTINVRFLASRVRLVVLVPNPISVRTFSEFLVRKNETALRDALLDPALAEGFEGCRILAAYENAKRELMAAAAAAKEADELTRERVTDTASSQAKPKNPHEDQLVAIITELHSIAAALIPASIAPAMKAIAAHTPLDETMQRNGQRWLFLRLCRAKVAPTFLAALSTLAGVSNPGIEEARRFADVLPAPQSLAALNDSPDNEKEEAGLEFVIENQPGYIAWDWAWWTGRLREEGLYQADDAGLAQKTDRLRETWQAYQAKAAEGQGIAQAQQAAQQAQSQQTATSYMDRLEMKFPLEVVAGAEERRAALLGHLDDHLDYYRYVLFQALPPGEQLRLLMNSATQLRVGMFEPHVVAMNGPYLAVPLTPLGQSALATTVADLQKILLQESQRAAAAADSIADDTAILPTPGVTVESWLGRCSGCEEHLEALRTAERRRAAAEASITEFEAERRKARLAATPPQLEDPVAASAAALRVELRDERQ